MDKRFLAILAVIIIIFAAIFAITQKSSNGGSSSGNSAKASNHVIGDGQSGVKLVEYGDFECPICEEYYPVVKQVQQKYDKQIFLQFRNLPLTAIHQNAFAGARAAEAAGMQGKYWEMHDLLYQNQDPTGASGWVASHSPLSYFDQFAQQLKLNVSQFDKDYASSTVNDTINADLAAFDKTGQPKATPTFFLDGQVLDNSKLGVPSSTSPGQLDVNASVANFSKFIDAAIAKKTATNKQ